ncbi:hypothetical protein [Sandarakinorhabdus sp.]|uniref:hypothetical protein n=1 Tax=Sandarakinorhabdus sp. TaxID=1916663 RepID=UPI003F72BF37
MTAVRPILTRFVGMLALSVVVWTAARLVYAAISDVPFENALPPTSLSVMVVVLMCFLNALPRNTPENTP